MSLLSDWTRWYSAQGFTPVRLASGSKVPVDHGWQRRAFHTPDEAGAFVAEHAGNLGISPGPGLVVLDLDRKNGADGVATVAALERQHGALPVTLTQRTPSGGEHRVFRLPAGISVRNGVGVAPGVDVRAQGGQIVAYPSTLADGTRWQWVDASVPIVELPAAWAQMLAAGPQRSALAPANSDAQRIPEGGRNDALARRAGAMRLQGVSPDALLIALADINARECDPPLEHEEVARIAASVSRYAPQAEPWQVFTGGPMPAGASLTPPGRAPRISVSDLETRPPVSPRFLIANILPAGVLTLLGAHGGVGKSTLALTAVVCLAAGRQFMGLPVEQCRVLFYSAEDPERLVRYRLRTICARLGVRPGDVDRHLLLLDATENPVLYDGAGRGTEALRALRYDVAEFKPGAIVIDNASDTFDSNEIERARVREFVRLLAGLGKAIDAAVLLLAHVDKATVKVGSSEGYSGSTAWHNSARSRLFMTADGFGGVRLEQQKNNLGPLASPIFMRWATGMLELLPATAAPGGSDDRSALLDEIRGALAEGVVLPSRKNAAGNAYALLHKRPGFPQRLGGPAFWQLLADLMGAGEIAEDQAPAAGRGKYRHVLRLVRPVEPSPT